MRSDLAKSVEARLVQVSRNSNAKIRAGIVGAGLMGLWHARAAKNAGGEVVAIADIDQRNAARLVGNYPSAKDFGSLEEMIDLQSLDVLHVCTPLSSHQTIAEIAIEAGINLIVEKPLAQTAAETIRLYDLASNYDVRLCPVHQFAFQPGVEKAKQWMPAIGHVLHMRATICSAGGENSGDEQLDLIVANLLPHPLSLFQVVLNNLLSDENWEVSRPRDGELRIEGYEGETSLSIFISMNARPTNNSLQIFGTKGTINIDLFHGFAVMETGKVSKTRKILHPFDLAVRSFSAATLNLMRRAVRFEAAYPGLRQLVGSFYQSVRDGSGPAITPAQTINVAQVRDLLIFRAGIKLTDGISTVNIQDEQRRKG